MEFGENKTDFTLTTLVREGLILRWPGFQHWWSQL